MSNTADKALKALERVGKPAANAANNIPDRITVPARKRPPKFDGTVESLIDVIRLDIINAVSNVRPKKYPLPSDIDEAHGTFMDMPTAIGKPLGECDRADLLMLSLAYLKCGHEHTSGFFNKVAEELDRKCKPIGQ